VNQRRNCKGRTRESAEKATLGKIIYVKRVSVMRGREVLDKIIAKSLTPYRGVGKRGAKRADEGQDIASLFK